MYKRQGDVFDAQTLKMFDKQKIAVGHVRYATSADAHAVLSVQPIVMHSKDGFLAICHNGHIVNGPALSASLRDKGVLLQSDVDSEILLHLIARRMEVGLEQAIIGMMQGVYGSYAPVSYTHLDVYKRQSRESSSITASRTTGFRRVVAMNLPEPSGSSPPEKPPGSMRIWD